jgi:hypothetical protein
MKKDKKKKNKSSAAPRRGGRVVTASYRGLTWYTCQIEGLVCKKCKVEIKLGEKHATSQDAVICEKCGEARWVKMKSKYASKCTICYKPIYKGQVIYWHADKLAVKHIDCRRGQAPKSTNRSTRLISGRETV